MSAQIPPPPPQKDSMLSNPQIIAAAITAITAVVVALITALPNLLPKYVPTETVVVVVVTPTVPSPTSTPTTDSTTEFLIANSTVDPSLTPVSTNAAPANTTVPTSLPIIIAPTTITLVSMQPTTNPSQPPNALLMYDEVSFTLLNQSTGTLSLEGVVFRSGAGEWDAVRWGGSIYNSIPRGKCLRLRDASVGQRQPPQPCVNQIYGLIEASGTALFWRNVEQFDVLRNGAVLATCRVVDTTCAIYAPS